MPAPTTRKGARLIEDRTPCTTRFDAQNSTPTGDSPYRELVAFATTYARRRIFARVVDMHPNPSHSGCWIVTVACPCCGQEHEHGTSPDDVRRMRDAEYREHVGANPRQFVIRRDIPLTGGDRGSHCWVTRECPGYTLAFTREQLRQMQKANAA